MKSVFIEVIVITLVCGWSIAQSTTASQSQAQPHRVAPGSVIPVVLSKTVDAKKVKVGDEVDAKVTQDMKAVNGEVIVAKDTKVVGHITEAQARSKEQKESEVGIAFDKAVMKDGTFSLPMSIQAVIAPQNPDGDNSASAQAAPSGSASANQPMGGSAGRSSGTAGTQPQQQASYPSASGNDSSSARPPITGNTQGVVGIPNYELSAAGDPARGSFVRSEKSNVKLESGTLLLLKVNQ